MTGASISEIQFLYEEAEQTTGKDSDNIRNRQNKQRLHFFFFFLNKIHQAENTSPNKSKSSKKKLLNKGPKINV